MIYYKATRPDGTSFYDGTTKWQVGRIVEHPAPDLSRGLCSPGVLHISDTPCETLLGFSWPCRLFEVEPRGEVIGPNGHKYGCTAVKVVRELPAWMALGPNGEAVAAMIERCRTITAEQAERLGAAWDAAWSSGREAWDAAWSAARDAVWDSARSAARSAAWDAASDAASAAAWDAALYAALDAERALLVRDLITAEQFDLLYGPWREVMES